MSKNVALSLSAGGARGLVHIGVINELIRRDYNIVAISGTSIGAVVGGVYAAGELAKFSDWMKSLDKYDVLKLIDFTFTVQGFIKGDRVFKELKNFLGEDLTIESLKIPFVAIAASLEKGEAVVFQEGDLYQALRASMAIPTVLTPVVFQEKTLVDGGIVAPLPLQWLQTEKADLVIAVDVNADEEGAQMPPKAKKSTQSNFQKKFEINFWNKVEELWPFGDKEEAKQKQKTSKTNYMNLALRSFDIMQNYLTDVALERYPPDITIKVGRTAADTFDFFKATELIAFGEELATTALDKYESNN